MPTPSVTRRDFLAGMTLAGSSLALTSPKTVLAAASPQPRWPVTVFSKAFQELSYEATADLVAEVGWDGIECPVRKGGQVLPERVEDDLPQMAAALKQRNKSLTIITTDIVSVSTPRAENVLRTAGKLGIRYYRLGNYSYAADKSIPDQLNEIRPKLRDLAALNQELGLCGGFQNHSGAGRVGAPVWDIYELIHDLDPRQMGICFDIGHATVEGGNAWSTHARLMEPYFCAIFVKDFIWQKSGQGWSVKWCPLGEGMIQSSFFTRLQKSGFKGPINQHFEFPLGTGAPMVSLLKKDLQTLKAWLG